MCLCRGVEEETPVSSSAALGFRGGRWDYQILSGDERWRKIPEFPTFSSLHQTRRKKALGFLILSPVPSHDTV